MGSKEQRCIILQPILPNSHPHLLVVYPVLTNKQMTTESQRYNCFTRNGGNAIPKHAGLEAKGSNPNAGLTLLWARNRFRGNFNHWQVSRKEARQIFSPYFQDFIFTLNAVYSTYSIYSVMLIFYFYWSHRSMINNRCTGHQRNKSLKITNNLRFD